jgi:hypothetical protein
MSIALRIDCEKFPNGYTLDRRAPEVGFYFIVYVYIRL